MRVPGVVKRLDGWGSCASLGTPHERRIHLPIWLPLAQPGRFAGARLAKLPGSRMTQYRVTAVLDSGQSVAFVVAAGAHMLGRDADCE